MEKALTGSNTPWQPRIITRFHANIGTSTEVLLVDTDQGEGYLKAMGNPMGLSALVNELIGTQLARWFKLPTLTYAIVHVTQNDELPFCHGGQAEPGPGFITLKEHGLPWSGTIEQIKKVKSKEFFSRLVLFDTWIRNPDRFPPPSHNYMGANHENLFLKYNHGARKFKYTPVAFDHSMCL